jgi:hypothetical protein
MISEDALTTNERRYQQFTLWGVAIDLDQTEIYWKTSKTTRFTSEYKQFIDIFLQSFGFVSLGKKNYDWMHFSSQD